NVAVQQDVKSTIARIAEKDSIDILRNNAGVAHVGTIENTLEEDFDRVYSVNVKGAYNCIFAVIPNMKKRGGVILNMASVASSVAVSDRFAYSVSKEIGRAHV